MGDESLCKYIKDHFKEDGYYFLIHVHVPWRIITRSNGGPGSFEYYFNGGKILCVYMYIGDYFYR